MKKIKPFLLLLLTFIIITSCFNDEDDTLSCINTDVIFEDDFYKLQAEVHTSKYLKVDLINKCDINIRVTGIRIEGQDREDFRVENLSIGTSITESTYFNVVFTPTRLGTRKGVIIIRHDMGEVVINLSGVAI